MAGVGSGYDLSTTTFSPDGRVFQLEYAAKATEQGGTTLGLACKDGVVLAVENLIPTPLLVPRSMRRIHAIDRHIGLAIAGLGPDGRHLVTRARSEAQNYRSVYGEAIPAKILAERVAGFAHLYSLYWHVRPFGCAALIGTWDTDVHVSIMYVVEPDGSGFKYRAYAQGKGRTVARTQLDQLPLVELSCADAVRELSRIIHESRDVTKDKPYELEMAWICEASEGQFQRVPMDLVEAARQSAGSHTESTSGTMDVS